MYRYRMGNVRDCKYTLGERVVIRNIWDVI